MSLGKSGWIPSSWGYNHVSVLNKLPRDTVNPVYYPYFWNESLEATLEVPLPKDTEAELYAETILFSLGILLLELTDEQLFKDTDFWRMYCQSGHITSRVRLGAAMEWLGVITGRHQPQLSDPIKWCLMKHFKRTANLKDRCFLQEILKSVIMPLETYIVN